MAATAYHAALEEIARKLANGGGGVDRFKVLASRMSLERGVDAAGEPLPADADAAYQEKHGRGAVFAVLEPADGGTGRDLVDAIRLGVISFGSRTIAAEARLVDGPANQRWLAIHLEVPVAYAFGIDLSGGEGRSLEGELRVADWMLGVAALEPGRSLLRLLNPELLTTMQAATPWLAFDLVERLVVHLGGLPAPPPARWHGAASRSGSAARRRHRS